MPVSTCRNLRSANCCVLLQHADVLVALEAAGEGEVGGRMVFSGSPFSKDGQDILQAQAMIMQQQRDNADAAAQDSASKDESAGDAAGGGSKETAIVTKTPAKAKEESDGDDSTKKSAAGSKLVQKEDQESGAVTLAVYISYIKVAGGFFVAFLAFIGFAGINSFQVCSVHEL